MDNDSLEAERDMYKEYFNKTSNMIHRISNTVFDGRYNRRQYPTEVEALESEVDDICTMLYRIKTY